MASSTTICVVATIFIGIYLKMIHSTFGPGNAYEQKVSMNLTDEFVWREMTLGDVHKLHDEIHPFLYKTFLSVDKFRNFNVTSFKVELRKAINV